MVVAQAELLEKVPSGLFIDGKDVKADGTFVVENPATGQALKTVSSASAEDGRRALDAAAASQGNWGRTAPRERAEILRKTFELVTARTEEFATLMTLEMGKPLAQARGEVAYGADFLRWFSEEAVRVNGRYGPAPDGKSRVLVQKKPVGPCLLITPWNFPLAMATRKIAPAVAAGCTMVVKPAALTPLTTKLLVQVMKEAGLPDGVLNVIQTLNSSEVCAPLIRDPRLRKLSFTGSTEVGKRLLAQASDNVLRTSMELGGNAPFLVFEDADLDAAVDGAVQAKMRNMGEACTAANRMIVHRSVAEKFAGELARRLEEFKALDGLNPESTLGPLIDEESVLKVSELVDDARQRGARLVSGGKRIEGPGYFFAPTVLDQVPSDARILKEEIFGPVAPIVTFTTEDEAVSLANDTQYGLAAYAFTQNLNRGLRLSERLESGMVGLNSGVISNAAAPFGGVKQSGLGREGSFEGIEEYLSTQYIGVGDPYAY